MLLSKLKDDYLVFINGKRTFVRNNYLEYYKLLQEIYTTIIFKKNSTVYKIFFEIFNLATVGKKYQISALELKNAIVEDLKICIIPIKGDGR